MDNESEPLLKHYHESFYDEKGQLTRQCAACGNDLLHESHVRGTTMVHTPEAHQSDDLRLGEQEEKSNAR